LVFGQFWSLGIQISLGYQSPHTGGSVWGGGMVEKIKLTQKKKK
jgi:hypothetical protein